MRLRPSLDLLVTGTLVARSDCCSTKLVLGVVLVCTKNLASVGSSSFVVEEEKNRESYDEEQTTSKPDEQTKEEREN